MSAFGPPGSPPRGCGQGSPPHLNGCLGYASPPHIDGSANYVARPHMDGAVSYVARPHLDSSVSYGSQRHLDLDGSAGYGSAPNAIGSACYGSQACLNGFAGYGGYRAVPSACGAGVAASQGQPCLPFGAAGGTVMGYTSPPAAAAGAPPPTFAANGYGPMAASPQSSMRPMSAEAVSPARCEEAATAFRAAAAAYGAAAEAYLQAALDCEATMGIDSQAAGVPLPIPEAVATRAVEPIASGTAMAGCAVAAQETNGTLAASASLAPPAAAAPVVEPKLTDYGAPTVLQQQPQRLGSTQGSGVATPLPQQPASRRNSAIGVATPVPQQPASRRDSAVGMTTPMSHQPASRRDSAVGMATPVSHQPASRRETATDPPLAVGASLGAAASSGGGSTNVAAPPAVSSARPVPTPPALSGSSSPRVPLFDDRQAAGSSSPAVPDVKGDQLLVDKRVNGAQPPTTWTRLSQRSAPRPRSPATQTRQLRWQAPPMQAMYVASMQPVSPVAHMRSVSPSRGFHIMF